MLVRTQSSLFEVSFGAHFDTKNTHTHKRNFKGLDFNNDQQVQKKIVHQFRHAMLGTAMKDSDCNSSTVKLNYKVDLQEKGIGSAHAELNTYKIFVLFDFPIMQLLIHI